MARDTRERLLDVALAQFAARGVEAVPVTDLEKGAGLSPGSGSFYRHFRSKADVLAAVVDREVDRVAAARDLQGPLRDMRDYYDWTLDNLQRMGLLIALLVREGASLPHLDRIRTVIAEGGVAHDAADLRARMERGDVPARDAEAVAAVVQAALTGYHLAASFFGGSAVIDRDRFTAALASMVTGSTADDQAW
ncbi:MAG: helix-turn-helix domain-containing protein [Mycobacteriales bacterium]|nr:helix-turn-helix domain-containing protein [Mycobacteriales bacterium]